MTTRIWLWRHLFGLLLLSMVGLARADITPPDLHQPTVIHTYLYLEDINDITLGTGTYDITALLVMRWKDPRLAFASADDSATPQVWMGKRAGKHLQTIWHPILDVVGEKGLTAISVHSLAVQPDGTVVLRQKFTGTPRFTGELVNFPFGSLNLGLTITSVAMDETQLRFKLEDLRPSQDMNAVDDILHGNWYPKSVKWDTASSIHPDAPELRFPQINLQIVVDHDFVDGVHKILLPLLVIALASWALLGMNFVRQASFSSPRIGGTVTLILTTIALKFALNQELPVVHYLTLSDVLFNVTIVMLSLSLLASCAVGAIFIDSGAERALRLNLWLRRLYPLLYVLVLLAGYFMVLG